jgi:two-component system, LytTR family, response regulator
MNCIIIDDEPLAREGLKLLIDQISSVKLVHSFSNAIDALESIMSGEVDLIFIDINMPEINGLDFVNSLKNNPLVIFVTAYPQYAAESYELNAIDYLVKPVRLERIEKAVLKAETYFKLLKKEDKSEIISTENAEFMFIKSDRINHKVFYRDILFIEGLKDYVVINLKDKKLITLMNIKSILALLPESIFYRVSKSYIVNLNSITGYNTHNVYLSEIEIPVGEIYKQNLIDLITK